MSFWCEVEFVNFGEEGEDECECEEILIRWWLIAKQHVVKIWTAVSAVRGCDWLALL